MPCSPILPRQRPHDHPSLAKQTKAKRKRGVLEYRCEPPKTPKTAHERRHPREASIGNNEHPQISQQNKELHKNKTDTEARPNTVANLRESLTTTQESAVLSINQSINRTTLALPSLIVDHIDNFLIPTTRGATQKVTDLSKRHLEEARLLHGEVRKSLALQLLFIIVAQTRLIHAQNVTSNGKLGLLRRSQNRSPDESGHPLIGHEVHARCQKRVGWTGQIEPQALKLGEHKRDLIEQAWSEVLESGVADGAALVGADAAAER